MRNLTIQELNEHYAKLLTDVNFDRLDLILKNPNIFNALKISNYEIRHSNFLAWLMDPHGNHGLNDIFLKRIIIEIISDERAREINVVDITKLLKQNVIVHREWSNIDILLEFEDTVIAIENKIRSGEHSNQLEKYFKIVDEHFPDKKRIFCYLTPFGIESSMPDKYIEIGYSSITSHLQDIYSLYENSLNDKVKIYIQDYIDNLKLNVMEDSAANKLARDIYIEHQELFEFIFENKPDEASEFLQLIESFLVKKGYKIGSPNKGYIRFTKPEIAQIFKPYNKNFGGWSNKEPFLFEIDFLWVKNKFVFKVAVAPSEYKLKQTLMDIMESIEGASKPIGKKWAVYFITSMQRKPLDEIMKNEERDINQLIDELYTKVQPIIEKVEQAILDNKQKIIDSIDY